MPRYYLRASGSNCYDKTGVTFPTHQPMNIEDIIKSVCEKPNLRWANQFGWSNQPKVLTFNATEQEVKGLDEVFPYATVLVTPHWNEEKG